MASADEVKRIFTDTFTDTFDRASAYDNGGWIAPSEQIQHLSPGNENMYKRIRDSQGHPSHAKNYGPNGPMMPGELTQDELETLEKEIANLERVIVMYGEDHVIRRALVDAHTRIATHEVIEKKYGPNYDTAKRSPGVQLKPARLIELDDTEA